MKAIRNPATTCVALIATLYFAPHVHAETFTVNSRSVEPDQTPGDGVCWTGLLVNTSSGSVPMCTLAAAVDESNALTGRDDIVFSAGLVADNPPYITIQFHLGYEITDAVTIDGYSAPGYDTDDPEQWPIVNITGMPVVSNDGIHVHSSAAGTVLRGIAVHGFVDSGVLIEADDVVVQGSHMGLAYGELVKGNDDNGISVEAIASNVIIGQTVNADGSLSGRHNVVVGSSHVGIRVRSSSTAVVGNRVGTDASGTSTMSNGLPTGNGSSGIDNSGSAGLIRDNTSSGNGQSGITLAPSNDAVGVVVVRDNRLGTDISGTYALGNDDYGLEMVSPTNTNSTWYAAGNVISGNSGSGVVIDGGLLGDTPVVEDNMIGVTADGRTVVPNGEHGVTSGSADSSFLIRANVIAGNIGNGVEFGPGAIGHRLVGNWIGTNPLGERLGNGGFGVEVLGLDQQIGGASAQDANIIGNNFSVGVIARGNASGAVIIGNYIGTDPRGENLGNGGHGISLGQGHTIGGLAPGSGNVIGFNSGHGIRIIGDANSIHGNYVGTDRYRRDLGNLGSGVRLDISVLNFASSKANVIGGNHAATAEDLAAVRNVIAFNGADGVYLSSPALPFVLVERDAIRGNEIFANAALGIDLDPVGENGNDLGDVDVGSNRGQNHPQIDAAATTVTAGGDLQVRYRVDSDPGAALYPITVDFYLSDSGSGSGRVLLGSHRYEALDAGQFVTVLVTPPVGTLLQGDLVATATDSASPGNTSEFSAALALDAVSRCGDIDLDGTVSVRDVHALRAHLADPDAAIVSAEGSANCGRIAGDSSCSLVDAVVLSRFQTGPALGPGIGGQCSVGL